MAGFAASTGAGPLLRGRRQRRRLSQLGLALEAGVSARHLSFVETGRSRPGAEMVLAVLGWGSPTTAGTVWVVLQALIATAFADVQGLARPRP